MLQSKMEASSSSDKKSLVLGLVCHFDATSEFFIGRVDAEMTKHWENTVSNIQ